MSDSESASIQKSDSKVENDDSATECFTVGIPLKYTARRKPSPIKKSSRNNQRYKARKGGKDILSSEVKKAFNIHTRRQKCVF
jgi:hypothetical protein